MFSISVITAQPFAVRLVFVPALRSAHASPMHPASCSAGFEDVNVSRIAGVSRTLFVLKQPARKMHGAAKRTKEPAFTGAALAITCSQRERSPLVRPRL